MKRAFLLGLPLLIFANSSASVTNYTSSTAWDAVTGNYQTINFTGLPMETDLTSQYSAMGAMFDGATFTVGDSTFGDGEGIYRDGVPGAITITFGSARTAFASDFPGGSVLSLYSGGTLVGTSQNFGGVGAGFFGGVTSTVAFNRVQITDWVDNAPYVDNIEFGTPAPEPTSLAALLGFAGLARLCRSIRRS